MIFFPPCGFKPRENSCYGVRKHTACSGQVGVCVPAQINICLTPQSRYYLTEIGEREVADLSPFHVYPLFFFFCLRLFPPSVIAGMNAASASDWRLSAPLGSWPKMRKKRRARIDEIINRDNNRSTTTH